MTGVKADDVTDWHWAVLQNVISGGTNHYPVSNQFMIGDYVMPGTVLVQQQPQPAQQQTTQDKKAGLS